MPAMVPSSLAPQCYIPAPVAPVLGLAAEPSPDPGSRSFMDDVPPETLISVQEGVQYVLYAEPEVSLGERG